MEPNKRVCPDCEAENDVGLNRRDFLKTVGVTAAATTAGLPLWATPKVNAAPTPNSAAETAVKVLYDKLSDEQKKVICFDWDYKDPARGLLRTHVSNNWQITKPHIRSNFYTQEQQTIIHDIFRGITNPEWWRFLEHAFWVVFSISFLTITCVKTLKNWLAFAEEGGMLEALAESEWRSSSVVDRASKEAGRPGE